MLLFLFCCMSMFCLPVGFVLAADYGIREIISVHPGEELARGLAVNDPFSLTSFSPVEGFIVYSWGYTAPAGDMNIELFCMADIAYSRRISFSIIVAGYSLKQAPVLQWKWARFPDAIAVTVPVQSTFGVYYIGVLVNHTAGDVDMPIPFAIAFSVSEGITQ